MLAFSVSHADQAPSAAELDKWFMSDDPAPPSQSADSDLIFIEPPTNKIPLHSINNITIKPQSLKNGWVELQQCYKQLDPVPEMEVVYQYKNLRKLSITSRKNIKLAYIKNQSVQLEDVSRNAELCISAQVKNFYINKNGTFTLKNGPYHRQFLDGFFPFHLTLKVTYPRDLLRFMNSKPKSQEGFIVTHTENTLLINSYFTGKLNTEISFKAQMKNR